METIENRLTAVENELIQIKRFLAMNNPQYDVSPWEKMFGSFADSEGFDEATRLGREYRESFRSVNEDDLS